jgi:hypothetical protein
MCGNAGERLGIRIGGLPRQNGQLGCEIGRMFAAATRHFEHEAFRRQDLPQDFKDRITIAGHVRTILAQIGHRRHSLTTCATPRDGGKLIAEGVAVC